MRKERERERERGQKEGGREGGGGVADPGRQRRKKETCAIMDSGLNWYRKSVAVLQDKREEEQEEAPRPATKNLRRAERKKRQNN